MYSQETYDLVVSKSDSELVATLKSGNLFIDGQKLKIGKRAKGSPSLIARTLEGVCLHYLNKGVGKKLVLGKRACEYIIYSNREVLFMMKLVSSEDARIVFKGNDLTVSLHKVLEVLNK